MPDLRDAFRALRATPIVSAVAILSLALGIGANTAIFSLVNSLMLRSLPVREPQQLVQVLAAKDRASWTNPLWEQLREQDNERLAPLRAVTADLDFEARYAVPLVRTVREVAWLRAARIERSRAAPPTRAGAGAIPPP